MILQHFLNYIQVWNWHASYTFDIWFKKIHQKNGVEYNFNLEIARKFHE